MSKNVLKIECDLDHPALISISLNDKRICCIQEFEFSVDVETVIPTIKFVFPDYAGYQDKFYNSFNVPIEILKSFSNVKIELKKDFENRNGFQLDESKLRLLATSSVPVEEIDLSKFDQVKSDIPA